MRRVRDVEIITSVGFLLLDARPVILNPKYATDTPIPMNPPNFEENVKKSGYKGTEEKKRSKPSSETSEGDVSSAPKKKRKVGRKRKEERQDDPEDDEYHPPSGHEGNSCFNC
jgi:hypothetical protein